MIKKFQSFALAHLSLLKPVIVAIMSIIAFFIAKDNSWNHWSWLTYGALLMIYLYAEFVQHKEAMLSPLEKSKKYLLDYPNWHLGSAEAPDYYSPAPEYTIRCNNSEDNLDFRQEWTRGEIGSSYTTGNAAYYMHLHFNETLLKKIHVVVFDGGKKTIVAPHWEALGAGRFYFYLQDSIEYAYQKYLSSLYKKDASIDINKSGGLGKFSIPVFKDDQELQSFIALQGEQRLPPPETDKEKQNEIFYKSLEKYAAFIA